MYGLPTSTLKAMAAAFIAVAICLCLLLLVKVRETNDRARLMQETAAAFKSFTLPPATTPPLDAGSQEALKGLKALDAQSKKMDEEMRVSSLAATASEACDTAISRQKEALAVQRLPNDGDKLLFQEAERQTQHALAEPGLTESDRNRAQLDMARLQSAWQEWSAAGRR